MTIQVRVGTAATAGFSLIELLVVVSIISVLAMLSIGVVAQMRGAALSTVCQNNLRQIGLAYSCYASDQENWIPPAQMYPVASHPYWGLWSGFLRSYMPDAGVSGAVEVLAVRAFRCPAHRKAMAYWNPLDFTSTVRSYAANCAYSSTAPHLGTRLGKLSRLGEIINLGERCGELATSISGAVAPPYVHTAIDADTYQPSGMSGITAIDAVAHPTSLRLSHRGKANLLFLDGRVQSMAAFETVATPCPVSGTVTPNLWKGSYTGSFYW